MAIKTITEEITAYDYIVKNWNNYGIEAIKSKQDMVVLLNILQANEENLDTMHDVVINGTKNGFFCDIYGEEVTADTINEEIESEDIRQTRDGYVLKVWC